MVLGNASSADRPNNRRNKAERAACLALPQYAVALRVFQTFARRSPHSRASTTRPTHIGAMPFQKGNKAGGRSRRSGRTSNIISTNICDNTRRKETTNVRSSGEPTPPPKEETEDEEMADGDGEIEQPGTPQADGEGDKEVGTPAQDREEEEEDGDSSPQITSIPRRRRGRGRGGARYSSRRTEADTSDRDGDDTGDAGTPFKRKRGRPPTTGRGRGGARGRGKGKQPETPRVIDKDGRTIDVVNDEAQVDDDEEGNEKVDELGNLQGGREYRVRTFKIAGRGERLYMLSTEPARCCGFRDSYLFFAKHPKLYKVLTSEEEKRNLIERDILPSSYKGRNIAVVTARSVFREFGARIIVAGKKVTDDYKVTEARENGEVEGELADPEDRVPDGGEAYNRNRYVAWFGASEVYRNAGQGAQAGQHPGAVAGGKQMVGRRRSNLTVGNWQFVHAREAR